MNGRRSYIAAAFNARPFGMPIPPNWFGVAAFALLGALVNPGFWLIGAGLEGLYLWALSRNERFRATVDAEGGNQTWKDRYGSLIALLDNHARQAQENRRDPVVEGMPRVPRQMPVDRDRHEASVLTLVGSGVPAGLTGRLAPGRPLPVEYAHQAGRADRSTGLDHVDESGGPVRQPRNARVIAATLAPVPVRARRPPPGILGALRPSGVVWPMSRRRGVRARRRSRPGTSIRLGIRASGRVDLGAVRRAAAVVRPVVAQRSLAGPRLGRVRASPARRPIVRIAPAFERLPTRVRSETG